MVLEIELKNALKPIYKEHQVTRKILEWWVKMRKYKWDKTLTDIDVQIWITAINERNYEMLVAWEELNYKKVVAALQRSYLK